MFYTLIKHGFFDQSEHTQGPIYILMKYKVSAMSCKHDILLRKKILREMRREKKYPAEHFGGKKYPARQVARTN